MTNEDLVMLYQLGDNHALEQLIEQNKGIIYKLVNRFRNNAIDSEFYQDLIQEGTLGLIHAANTYDFENENKAQFITYAVYWINQKISRHYKTVKRLNESSLNEFAWDDDETEKIDLLPDDSNYEDIVIESLYNQELRKDMYISMNKVNSLIERQVLELHYGLNRTIPMEFSEIERLLSIKLPKKASIYKNSALRKLRNSPVFHKYKSVILQEYYFRKYQDVDTLLYGL